MKAVNDVIIYGPVWLSKGERFRPTGAYIFLECRYKEFQSELKKLRKKHRELTKIMNEKPKRKPMNNNEMDDEEEEEDEHLSSTEGTDKEGEKMNDISLKQDKSLLSMKKKEMEEMKKVNRNRIL
jgi:hypothetical protein